MKKFMTFIQGILLINNNDNRRVGLSQFKENTVDFVSFSYYSSRCASTDASVDTTEGNVFDLLRRS